MFPNSHRFWCSLQTQNVLTNTTTEVYGVNSKNCLKKTQYYVTCCILKNWHWPKKASKERKKLHKEKSNVCFNKKAAEQMPLQNVDKPWEMCDTSLTRLMLLYYFVNLNIEYIPLNGK